KPHMLAVALDGINPRLGRTMGKAQRGVAERGAELEDAPGVARSRQRAEQRAVAIGPRAAAVLGAVRLRRVPHLRKRIDRFPRSHASPRRALLDLAARINQASEPIRLGAARKAPL